MIKKLTILALVFTLLAAVGLDVFESQAQNIEIEEGTDPALEGDYEPFNELADLNVPEIQISSQQILFIHSGSGSQWDDISDLAGILKMMGFILTEKNLDFINSSELNPYDIIVFSIYWTKREISSSEAEAIANFVQDGGSLLLIGELGVASWSDEWNNSTNKIGGYFGIEFNFDMVCDPTNHYPYPADPDGGVDMPFITDISHHEVTDEVEKFMLTWGCSLEVTPPATTIAHTDSDAWLDINSIWNSEVGHWECYQDDFEETGRFPTLAVCQYGNGRVVAIGEKGWLINGWLDNYDHYELAINIFEWLSFNPVTFRSAYYSPEIRTLAIRFHESISDAPGLQPDLNKIKVHDAGSDPVGLGGNAQYEVLGDTLKITNLSDEAHNAIADVGNPQVDIDTAAVYDLAGNPINRIMNRPITYDVGGPELSATGNTYEHISLDEEDNLVTDGLLTLTFTEVIDGSSVDTAKIKLQAGTTSIDLAGAEPLTGTEYPNATTLRMKIEDDDDKVGDIAGLQKEFDTLYVRLEAGAVTDLIGNDNAEDVQAIETWIGDTRKPELDLRASYYIHDLRERGTSYARLVLKFDEPMDPRPAYIDASGIVLTDGGDNMVTLTLEEIKPDQGFSTEIQFNLTDAHRDTISVWGEPKVIGTPGSTDPPYIADTGGLTKTELSIYLAENSVTDRAGNSVVVFTSATVFAKAAAYDPADADVDEREYDSDLAADIANEEGTDYSSWEKDLKPAEFVSAAYDANTKKLTITFDEWMDVAPVGIVDSKRIRIYDADYPSGDYVDLAGDATENEKTKTITVTLTPEKGVDVKELKTPLYIALRSEDTTTVADGILDVGPARDIAGNPCAILTPDADTGISYTKDTTKPTLVRTNGDDTTYRHKGKDFGAPDDITGLLSLVFNEGVDKDYNAIDASKIRLSNTSSGGGFALTQEEIYTAPGNRVYPLATSYVHIIQFDLNDAHWNTIATEKWSTMYIQMEAGAVSDTSGNAIAAVTMDIHPDNYHTDETPPDVRLPESPISEANAGEAITITATVTDDIEVRIVRLYYQIGGAPTRYIDMTNTEGDTYQGTIPGTAVTNRGLCYYVWAEDQAGNENITPNGYVKMREGDLDEWFLTSIPGGFNVKITGTVILPDTNLLPDFDEALLAKQVPYRMVSVPTVSDPAITSLELFKPFEYQRGPGEDWVAWYYTSVATNYGYQAGHTNPFTFSPGVAAWVGTVNPDNTLTVTGETSQISDKLSEDATQDIAPGNRYLYEITLHAGWNQIAIPFNFLRCWNDETIELDGISNNIYWFTGESSDYNFASMNPTVPNQTVFADSWRTASPHPDYEIGSGWPGTLDPWGGYWVYANKEGATLKINPMAPGKGVEPTEAAPSVQMPYNWSVKLMAEAGGVIDTAKYAGIVADATDGIDKYDVMALPAFPCQNARLSFVNETGDYLQDMKAPADEMIWQLKVNSDGRIPIQLRFDASAVPSEYRTVLLIDTETEVRIDLRKAASYVYKPSEKVRNFKLVISKAVPEVYAATPKVSELLQNYPNPFNPETWIPFKLAKDDKVTIQIYNAAGQLVRTLELGFRKAGAYTFRERTAHWDGRNGSGEKVASGLYFYTIRAGSFYATKKMVILK